MGSDTETHARPETLRLATDAQGKLQLRDLDSKGQASECAVRPLGSCFWGQIWTLAAWCEHRLDFRSVRDEPGAARPICSGWRRADQAVEFWLAAATTRRLPWLPPQVSQQPTPTDQLVDGSNALALSTCQGFHMDLRGAPIAPPFWWTLFSFVNLKIADKARQ